MESHHTLAYWFGSAVSASTVIAAIMGFAPAVAALVGLIYYLIQIYESATVQRWRANRRTHKLAHLKAQVLLLEAQMKPSLPGPEQGGTH